jgi:hypothetical protein
LLNGEDEIVRSVQGGWRHRWIVAPEANLKGPDRFAQRLGRVSVIIEAKRFNVVQQGI